MSDKSDVAGCFKLLAAIIDDAVDDFEGGFLAEKRDAAAFFRGDEIKWMVEFVGGTVDDVIQNRLTRDPFEPVDIGRDAYKATCPGALVKYKGKSLPLSGWSLECGVTIGTLRTRIKKYGVCGIVFHKGRLNKSGGLL